MEGPGTKLVDNETSNQATRTTKEGRKYVYKINVIQQPLRARACGSGAKCITSNANRPHNNADSARPASADRRPVDPPPIVELKIYEHYDGEERDVTFAMNANYFLFATLEQARNVAHGRVQQDQSRLTVLTGTPVAGMVYLDRPKAAGYFIFPDLSVRHEGKYRLSFSLYEELKEPKDEDQNETIAKANGSGDAHVTHRLEVKSIPFTVYSAKKFPGLTESTALSRMVAEQGCRVRIRRDVRMRKRDPKSGKDWDAYEDETADARARISATPELGYPSLPPPHGFIDPVARPRSGSNASHHSLAPSLAISRRPSSQELSQGYQQAGYSTAPHTPQASYPQSSPYGSSMGQQYPQPPFMQQQSAMQPPPPHYQQQAYQPPPALPQGSASQQSYGGYNPAAAPSAMPQSQFPPPTSGYEPSSHSQRSSMDYSSQMSLDRRRSSAQYPPPPPPPLGHNPLQSHQQQPYQGHIPPQMSYQPPPPPPAPLVYPTQYAQQPQHGEVSSYSNQYGAPESVQPPSRPTETSTPLSARPPFNNKLPPLRTSLGSMSSGKQVETASPSPAAPQSAYYTSAHTPIDTHKREFGKVFSERHQSQPLRQGARPGTPSYNGVSGVYNGPVEEDEPDFDPQAIKVSYRRADGRQIERKLPAHN